MLASRSGYSDNASFLLDSGAEPNIQNKNGTTALMLASVAGYSEVVHLLKDRADLNIQCLEGATAPIYANGFGHVDIVGIPLNSGGRIDIEDNNGMTALKRADTYEWYDCADRLCAELQNR